ncbi:MAG: hypothetical protein MZV70_11260 [Desulfobacterales bacterium]|nr:hypothetical protein [Desulfobacterales bacterium]
MALGMRAAAARTERQTRQRLLHQRGPSPTDDEGTDPTTTYSSERMRKGTRLRLRHTE